MKNKNKKKSLLQKIKNNRNKGKIDRGSIYVVIVLITLITAGYLLVGGTLPTRLPRFYNNNLVQVSVGPPPPARGALQLYSFSGDTATPAPTPDFRQPPASASGQWEQTDCNHVLLGDDESQMIWAIDYSASLASGNKPAIKAFYTYADNLVLGAGTTTTPMNKLPADHTINPNVGNLTPKDPDNFPYMPAVFLTDITLNPSDMSGDGQNGTPPQKPSDVYGAWKTLNRPDTNPPNAASLPGADPWPASNGPSGNNAHDLSYTSEIIWTLADLRYNGQPLIPKHIYRAQIVLHAGSKKEAVGEICINFQVPT